MSEDAFAVSLRLYLVSHIFVREPKDVSFVRCLGEAFSITFAVLVLPVGNATFGREKFALRIVLHASVLE
jgi:hypothetical protein